MRHRRQVSTLCIGCALRDYKRRKELVRGARIGDNEKKKKKLLVKDD